MNRTITPAPVRRSITVSASPPQAFEVFARHIDRWWPHSHSIGSAPMSGVTIEPFAGGRWYETGADGSECNWGRVLAWEPPYRLLLAWQIGGDWKFDPDLVTEVEITLTEEGANRTRVDLEHRHLERMGDKAQTMAESIGSPNGWSAILAQYASACST
jgi:uncharacterized protein YndB with AHSA1/START domain